MRVWKVIEYIYTMEREKFYSIKRFFIVKKKSTILNSSWENTLVVLINYYYPITIIILNQRIKEK